MSILDVLDKYKLPMTTAVIGMGLVVGALYLRPSTKKQIQISTDDSTTVGWIEPNQANLMPMAIYVPLKQADLDDAKKAHIERQIANLDKLGHTNSTIHLAFKKATHAKMSYRFGRKQPVSFTVIDIADVLPQGFILTGRQYEGEMGVDGYDAIYRLYENPNDKIRLEITQTHISTDAPRMLISELYREQMGGVPVFMEKWQDAKGVVYCHAQFVVGSSDVAMSAKGMDVIQFRAVVMSVIDRGMTL